MANTIPSLIPITGALSDSLLIIHDAGANITGKITVEQFMSAPRKVSLGFSTTTAFSPVVGNKEQIVEITNASAITVTIPIGVFAVGDQMHFRQGGVGQVSFAGVSGVTIEVPVGATPALRAKWELATIYCKSKGVGVETWCLFGGLNPA